MAFVISLSGGLDSTALLATAVAAQKAKNGGQHYSFSSLAVSFVYGSKHNEYEVAAARRVAEHFWVPHKTINIAPLFEAMSVKSSLMKNGDSIPEGHYNDTNMKSTVVPGRNSIFASLLASIAESHFILGEGKHCGDAGLNEYLRSLEGEKTSGMYPTLFSPISLYMGVHAGDHYIYPDCRPSFIEGMKQAITVSTNNAVRLSTPFLHETKAQIIQNCIRQGIEVPYAMTRTCYKDQPIACGKCGSCQERLAAFLEVGREDPLEYESREILPEVK